MPSLSPHPLHDWNLTPTQAVALQRELACRVERRDCIGEVRRIAGVDIGFEQGGEVTRAAVVVLDYPSLEVIGQVVTRVPTRMPYIPGLLSFREVPAALQAFAELPSELRSEVGLLMVDGHGIAHPRRMGVAAHLGLWLDLPSLGVAKKRLTGRHGDVADERGAWTPLTDGEETLGVVMRTRQGVKPIFVSPGHRLSVDTATQWALACLGRYKLPEPTRLADRLASRRGQKS